MINKKKDVNKWAFVLLSIAAIVTVIGLGIWIAVAVCCKCVASQLIMGFRAQGCVLVHLQYAYREPTHSHTCCDHNVTL